MPWSTVSSAHPNALWSKGRYGQGYLDTHGHVVSWPTEAQAPRLEPGRDTPDGVYATFNLSPGGHADVNFHGPIGASEFYRLLGQAHPEAAPHWTRGNERTDQRWGDAATQSLTTSDSRTAGATLPQEVRQWQQLNHALSEKYQPKREVLHTFPSGHTIQKMNSCEDVNRVGKFMHNCWQGTHPAHWEVQTQGSETPSSGNWAYHTLHDEHDLPRAAFFLHNNPYTIEPPVIKQALGMRNQPVEPEHALMLKDWADTNGYKYVPPLWSEVNPNEPTERVRLPGTNVDVERGMRGRIGDPERLGKTAGLTHFNDRGKPCNCTFAAHIVTSHTAGKLHDFLMSPKSRPDLQTPEAQSFLSTLGQHHNEKTDALMPWITREWKKGRIEHMRANPENPHAHGLLWYDEDPDDVRPEREHVISPDVFNHWADFYRSSHPLKREMGDIMQHNVHGFHDRIKSWEHDMANQGHQQALAGGQVVHTTPDGWTVRNLTTPEELKAEGAAMGHCVGGYHQAVDRGDSIIHSLRDPQGKPHATMEITPERYQDPHPDAWLEHAIANDPVVSHAGPDLHDALRRYHQWQKEKALGVPQPSKLTDEQVEYQGLYNQQHDKYKNVGREAIPQGGTLTQIQGKGNETPLPEYQERIKHYFTNAYSDEDRPQWEDSDGSGYRDDEGYWHSELDHPDHIIDENGQMRSHMGEPDAYGLATAPIHADYDSLLNNIGINDHGYYSTHDPAHVKSIYNLARERGEIPGLAAALEGYSDTQDNSFQDWIDQNWEIAPRYPDEPHGHEDENGEDIEEGEQGKGKPYWQVNPQDNERQYSPEEAEEEYDAAMGEWQRQHPGTQATSQMYELLAPHYRQGEGYVNRVPVNVFSKAGPLRQGSPVDDSYWEEHTTNPDEELLHHWQEDVQYPRWTKLYHGTTYPQAEQILQEGLRPWDEVGRHNWNGSPTDAKPGWQRPRPGHVYLTNNIDHAWTVAPGERWSDNNTVLEIDPRHLSPANINPDEDDVKQWTGDPDFTAETSRYPTKGDAAEAIGWGDDEESTGAVLDYAHSLAHRGPIPPQAIRGSHVFRHDGWHFTPNPNYQPPATLSHAPSVRQGGMTPNQYKRQMVELEQRLGPDKSPTVHQWGDGWRVVAPKRARDIERHGTLMGNCWQRGFGNLNPHVLLDHHNIPRVAWNIASSHMMHPLGRGYPGDVHYPFMADYPSTKSPSGHANSRPSEEYMARVYDWANAQPKPPMAWRQQGDSQYIAEPFAPQQVDRAASSGPAKWTGIEPSHSYIGAHEQVDASGHIPQEDDGAHVAELDAWVKSLRQERPTDTNVIPSGEPTGLPSQDAIDGPSALASVQGRQRNIGPDPLRLDGLGVSPVSDRPDLEQFLDAGISQRRHWLPDPAQPHAMRAVAVPAGVAEHHVEAEVALDAAEALALRAGHALHMPAVDAAPRAYPSARGEGQYEQPQHHSQDYGLHSVQDDIQENRRPDQHDRTDQEDRRGLHLTRTDRSARQPQIPAQHYAVDGDDDQGMEHLVTSREHGDDADPDHRYARAHHHDARRGLADADEPGREPQITQRDRHGQRQADDRMPAHLGVRAHQVEPDIGPDQQRPHHDRRIDLAAMIPGAQPTRALDEVAQRPGGIDGSHLPGHLGEVYPGQQRQRPAEHDGHAEHQSPVHWAVAAAQEEGRDQQWSADIDQPHEEQAERASHLERHRQGSAPQTQSATANRGIAAPAWRPLASDARDGQAQAIDAEDEEGSSHLWIEAFELPDVHERPEPHERTLAQAGDDLYEHDPIIDDIGGSSQEEHERLAQHGLIGRMDGQPNARLPVAPDGDALILHGQGDAQRWDVDHEHAARLAGMTGPQQQRAWGAIAPPPNSYEIAHQFPDGSHIRTLNTTQAINATGEFMRNCWQGMPPEDHQMQAEGGWGFHTLNDPNGLPQVAFNTQRHPQLPNPRIRQPLGMRNEPINEQQTNALRDWAEQSGIDHSFPPAQSVFSNWDYLDEKSYLHGLRPTPGAEPYLNVRCPACQGTGQQPGHEFCADCVGNGFTAVPNQGDGYQYPSILPELQNDRRKLGPVHQGAIDRCPHCGATDEYQGGLCYSCGYGSIPCPRCGEETGANQGYCISCGYQVHGEGNPTQTPAWTHEPEHVTQFVEGQPRHQGAASKLYHVGWAEDAPKIAQEGLQPIAPWGTDNHERPGVYLYPDLKSAQSLAADRQEPTVIYEVDASGHRLVPDPVELGAYYTEQAIHPSAIRRIASIPRDHQHPQDTSQQYQPPPRASYPPGGLAALSSPYPIGVNGVCPRCHTYATPMELTVTGCPDCGYIVGRENPPSDLNTYLKFPGHQRADRMKWTEQPGPLGPVRQGHEVMASAPSATGSQPEGRRVWEPFGESSDRRSPQRGVNSREIGQGAGDTWQDLGVPMELTAGDSGDTHHYHVAPRHARESILQQGLTPMSMPNRLWEESHDNRVHLWHSDGDALDWIDWTRQQRGEEGDPWDIWEVNSSGLPLEPDEYLPTSAVTHEGTIPPERLRLANDDYRGYDDRVSTNVPRVSGPMRYLHFSPHRFSPGEEIGPASELTPEQWAARPHPHQTNDNTHLDFYDPHKVYMFDDRFRQQDYDLPVDYYDWHGYEVQPMGPVEQDPEVAAIRQRWEQRHGHPFGNPDDYGYEGPGWVPGCEECQRENEQGYEGPEWYHPYAWATPRAQVLRQVYDPQTGFDDDPWLRQKVQGWGNSDKLSAVPADDPVGRWISQGQLHPYRELPPNAQKAIAHYMAIDGEAWPYHEDLDVGQGQDYLERALPRYVQEYGDHQFGYHPGIPMEEMRQAIMSKNRDIVNDHPSWDSYHQWYVGRGSTPSHTEQWPVILDRDYGDVLEDGWHRLHSYHQQGFPTTPAVWYPREGDKLARQKVTA